MSGRQSSSAIFIGRFWGLGKTDSDPMVARASQVEAAGRWVVTLERDLKQYEESSSVLGAWISRLRRERDITRWHELYGELLAQYEALEHKIERLRATAEKLDSVRAKFEGDGSITQEVPLWQLARALKARADRIPPLRKLPEFAPPKGKTQIPKLSTVRSLPQPTDSPQESDFAAKLRRALAASEKKP